jgi:glucose/arabinose dehydrogenase
MRITAFRPTGPDRRCPPLAALLVVAALLLPACAQAQPQQVQTSSGAVRVEVVADGLASPWGMAVLPDGRLLVTEHPGRLRVVTQDGQVSPALRGVPQVSAQGQGGLLDVVLDPAFAENRRIYLSFAEPGEGGAAGTAVARARLNADATALEGTEVIWRQQKVDGGNHFGSRLVFTRDGNLFVALGERYKFDPAQDLSNTLGTVVRIAPDGSVPRDNPFVGRDGARPEIWSYGHRNIEAAALHPETGELWIAEMGPRGGDELNRPEAGRNYGWPLVSWGNHYNGQDIPDPPTRPDLAGSVHQWTPVISPSGMVFYTGDAFPDWRGDMLIGGLSARAVVRVRLRDGAVQGEERIGLGARIRDVAQGPDGSILVLTDAEDGRLLRLTPAR